MRLTVTVAIFRQITEFMRSGHFLLNYWTGMRKRIQVSAKGSIFSRRFRRKSTTLTVASFFRQFNAIGPLFLFICSTS